MTINSTISPKYQTTVPKTIRDQLGINSGDRLEWVALENGNIVVKPVKLEAKDVAGKYSQYAKGKSLEKADYQDVVNDAMGKHFAKKL